VFPLLPFVAGSQYTAEKHGSLVVLIKSVSPNRAPAAAETIIIIVQKKIK
jgi:hypothetical protein